MAGLTQRMIRAAKLDVNLYEEVEADPKSMGQAMTVVVLSAVAAGIGAAGRTSLVGLIVISIASLAYWYIWA